MNIKNLNKIELKNIPSKLFPILEKTRRYGVIIFVCVVFIIYSFLIIRINSLARKEPTNDQLSEELLTIKKPVINQDDVDKLLHLEDNSSEVKALFKRARDNPFHE